MLQMSISKDELKDYTSAQLKTFFPDKYKFEGKDIDNAIDIALERVEYNFKHITLTGYSFEHNPYFYHLHSDQYSSYLYFLSNSLWELSGNKVICDKLILLNRALHGIWVTYKCCLPDIFLLSHPIGTILGNAEYADFLCVFQNVTVNTGTSLENADIPVMGKGVVLGVGSSILGNSSVGDRVTLTDVSIYKNDIPSNSSVYRDETGKIIIKKRSNDIYYAQQFFNTKI